MNKFKSLICPGYRHVRAIIFHYSFHPIWEVIRDMVFLVEAGNGDWIWECGGPCDPIAVNLNMIGLFFGRFYWL